MSSFVITDTDRTADGRIASLTERAPDAPSVPPPIARPTRPGADQAISAYLPPAPAVPTAAAIPSAPPPSRRVQLASIALLGIVALLAWFAWQRPSDAPLPRPAPSVVSATAAPAVAVSVPSAAPTTASSACTTTRAAATFYAPAGDATGDALDPGTACVLVAWHAGFPDWRQIAAGGAPIWVRASVLSETSTAGLPDLAPPPTVTPAPATARPVVIVEPPAPTQCATVRGGGATIQRCGSAPLDQLQADAEAAWRMQMQPTTTGGE